MQLTVHQTVAVSGARALRNLDAMLDKAAAFCESRKIDPSVLLQARLAPDMFPLVRQVQLACDFAKGPVARLSGTENPKHPDTETSLEGLKERIARTLEFIAGVPASAFDGAEDRDIVIQAGPRTLEYKGLDYLLGFALPNLNFHATCAYAILRHNGVELGKADYIGPSD